MEQLVGQLTDTGSALIAHPDGMVGQASSVLVAPAPSRQLRHNAGPKFPLGSRRKHTIAHAILQVASPNPHTSASKESPRGRWQGSRSYPLLHQQVPQVCLQAAAGRSGEPWGL